MRVFIGNANQSHQKRRDFCRKRTIYCKDNKDDDNLEIGSNTPTFFQFIHAK